MASVLAHGKTFILFGYVALTLTTAGAVLAQYAMSALPVKDAPLSIVLQGGPFIEESLLDCTYDHFTRDRMSYWFNISWGDGTISDLQSEPDGESCADIGHHTYDKAGRYEIGVYIDALGNVGQPVPLYNRAAVVVIGE